MNKTLKVGLREYISKIGEENFLLFAGIDNPANDPFYANRMRALRNIINIANECTQKGIDLFLVRKGQFYTDGYRDGRFEGNALDYCWQFADNRRTRTRGAGWGWDKLYVEGL